MGNHRKDRANRSQGKDRKSTRLNSSLVAISYAVFCLKKKQHLGLRLYSPDAGHDQDDAVEHAQHAFDLGDEVCFFFSDAPTTDIYTLSLHDALPIYSAASSHCCPSVRWRRMNHSGSSAGTIDRKSTRLNSSHVAISYAVFCLKK